MSQPTTINDFIYGPDEMTNIYRFLQQIDETESSYIALLTYTWANSIKLFMEYNNTALYIYCMFIKTHTHFPKLDRFIDIIYESQKYYNSEIRFIRNLIFEIKA